MLISLHLCGPQGDALRQLLERSLEILKDDNACVISAMINAGFQVRDTMRDLGLRYQPAEGDEKNSPVQNFYGLAGMLERGTFACGEAAAYEAAVMQVKYGVPASIIVAPQGGADFHALYVTEFGLVDPTQEWLDHMNARAKLRTAKRMDLLPVTDAGPSCNIVPGTNTVECSEVPGYQGCCISEFGLWNCPSNPAVHGTIAEIRQIESRAGQRWALVGSSNSPAPLCTE